MVLIFGMEPIIYIPLRSNEILDYLIIHHMKL